MATLVMNIKNENNLKAMIDWCNQYHIEYNVMNNGVSAMPNLVDDSTKSVKSTTRTKDKEFAKLENIVDGKSNKAIIGDFVSTYSDINAVRYWEVAKFTPSKVKYGISKSLKEAGASWDSTLDAYTFPTKKAFNAWCKAQKNR